MTIKRKLIVPGLEIISSDSDDDDNFKHFKNNIWRNQILSSDVIMIGDSDDNDSDIDIISVEGITERKTANEVWRNIIECDLLDEGIKCIGFDSIMVQRDVESYELPVYKIDKPKRKRLSRRENCQRNIGNKCNRNKKITHPRFRRRRSRSRSRTFTEDDPSSADELEIVSVQYSKKICKDECMDDKGDDNVTVLDSDSSDASSEDENSTKLDTWTKLIDHLHNDQFQIEFEDGRRIAARRIASELNEPKIDLIDRCLIYLGVEKCRVFLEATKKIELAGGMPTKDGSRRRTAGGVFLAMIRADRGIAYATKEQIFLDADNGDDANDSLWWKSLESFQYRRNPTVRGVSNYGRKKEFRSYTLLDLDYFQSIRDFRYRYIPIQSHFPLSRILCDEEDAICDLSSDEEDDDDVTIIDPPKTAPTDDLR